ncbi:hypothetical protein WMY93_026681 [Mugilogobius chulae]|uniref:Secreted protein n=1 Tax=Mugilogobius chulae TaxID=88201 RepID=A0AAW0NA45_9GOBI
MSWGMRNRCVEISALSPLVLLCSAWICALSLGFTTESPRRTPPAGNAFRVTLHSLAPVLYLPTPFHSSSLCLFYVAAAVRLFSCAIRQPADRSHILAFLRTVAASVTEIQASDLYWISHAFQRMDPD